jgi:hypothetical protein
MENGDDEYNEYDKENKENPEAQEKAGTQELIDKSINISSGVLVLIIVISLLFLFLDSLFTMRGSSKEDGFWNFRESTRNAWIASIFLCVLIIIGSRVLIEILKPLIDMFDSMTGN